MRLLVVGEFRVAFHEEALAAAWQEDGHVVRRFRVASYFNHRRLSDRLQARATFGPCVAKLNSDLKLEVTRFKPDAVFVYRGRLIAPETIAALGRVAPVFGFNNDNPFSDKYPWYFWKRFLKGLPHYAHIFSYRESNIPQYQNAGAKSVSLLRSFYLRQRNFPIDPKPGTESPFQCDIAFIGHYEPDGRERLVLDLIRSGFHVRLFGPEWQRAPSSAYREIVSRVGVPRPLERDYNYAINSARVALALYSTLNQDTYTRRCFEIPATKTAMLCQYSEDMETLFEPEKEAVFFRSSDECAQKAASLLQSTPRRLAVGRAGYDRLCRDGHEAHDRARQVVEIMRTHFS